jgi:hypothetical protein
MEVRVYAHKPQPLIRWDIYLARPALPSTVRHHPVMGNCHTPIDRHPAMAHTPNTVRPRPPPRSYELPPYPIPCMQPRPYAVV